MKVLYYTNSDIKDEKIIPDIIKKLTKDEILFFDKKKDLNFIKKNKIDFIVSDRSRHKISDDVINFLDKKIINLHPSFLPWNKGYYPNYWSIIDQTPHGVTIHYIDSGIDTGDIIARTEFVYSKNNDTLNTTYKRLRVLMVSLFENCWKDIRNQNVGSKKQEKGIGKNYKQKDFEGKFEKLSNGWNTKIENL